MADSRSSLDDWEIRSIHLPYRVGSIRLTRVPLRFAVLKRHFTKLEADAHAIRPPLDRWSDDVLGALVMSHPIGVPLPRVTVLEHSIRYVPKHQTRYYIDMRGTFEGYLGKFSSKTRATLKKKLRRFAERSGGKIDWREYKNPEQMREFHRFAREVAVKTYQEHLLGAAIPAREEFILELEHHASEGLARGYLLFLDGRPIAYLYCPIWDGAVVYEFLGYDPAVRELSPGTVLQYLVLERLFAERAFTVFDFTEGEGQHKELFSTGKLVCADVFHFRKSALSASVISGHLACSELTRGAVAVLELLDARTIARKYLRSMHTSAKPDSGETPPGD